MKIIRTLRLLGAAVLLASAFSSCNTTRGVGQDVSHLGNHIQRATNH